MIRFYLIWFYLMWCDVILFYFIDPCPSTKTNPWSLHAVYHSLYQHSLRRQHDQRSHPSYRHGVLRGDVIPVPKGVFAPRPARTVPCTVRCFLSFLSEQSCTPLLLCCNAFNSCFSFIVGVCGFWNWTVTLTVTKTATIGETLTETKTMTRTEALKVLVRIGGSPSRAIQCCL